MHVSSVKKSVPTWQFMLRNKKTVGIIGGMGPLATADLFSKIILCTHADKDQDHLHVIIDNNTDIPDRTKAILLGGEDPLEQMVLSAHRLQSAGADFLIMPCNTAHYFYGRLKDQVYVPVLNMLEETGLYLRENGITCAGLLATDGTIRSGIYEKALAPYGISLLLPEPEEQEHVMHVIYDGIKAGNPDLDPTGFISTCKKLMEKGAQTLILGCTELPPAFSLYHIDLPHTDPTLILAEAAVRFAGGECMIPANI